MPERGKKLYRENREILYEMHDYDPSDGTHNTHHIEFRSEGGGDELDNLALIDKKTHSWIHRLINKMDSQTKP